MGTVEDEKLQYIDKVKPTEKSYFDNGGLAQIWKGEWLPEGSSGPPVQVAIKVLIGMHNEKVRQEKWIQRLKREHRCWRQAKHKNIVQFLGVSRDNINPAAPSPGLVSPLYNNGNITNYLSKHKNPGDEIGSPRNRMKLVKEIAVGLHQLHTQWNILHGDLKPSNVFINDDGSAAIADFGQSKIVDERGYTTKLSGSARYMAPELQKAVDDDQDDADIGPEQETDTYAASALTTLITQKSDVYAFSMTALEVVSGSAPFFRMQQDATVIVKVVQGRRPVVREHPKTPEQLWPLLQKGWQANSHARPDMTSVVNELNTISIR